MVGNDLWDFLKIVIECEVDYFLFKDWTLLGTTILKKNEWVEVLKSVKYKGDYFFTNATTLKLERLEN